MDRHKSKGAKLTRRDFTKYCIVTSFYFYDFGCARYFKILMSLPAKNYLCTDYKKQTKSRWAKKGKKYNKKCLKSA